MSGAMRRDEAGGRPATTAHNPAPRASAPETQGAGPAHEHAADPRFSHLGGTVPGLLGLQRSAGNAAVASMVAPDASVQRAVTIDEIDVSTPAPGEDTGDTDGTGAGAGGAVTSDGGTTTITGGVINIEGGQVNLDAGMTRASGVLQADTLIANSVVASSYTPGAGNVL